MSVVKGDRSESKLGVITSCRRLCAYTVHICKNENNFPKRDRWILTGKIVNEILEAMSCLRRANAVRVMTAEDYTYRRGQQVEAYSHLEASLTLIDIAFEVLSLDAQRVEFWTGSILEVETLLQGWRKSDRARYGALIKELKDDDY